MANLILLVLSFVAGVVLRRSGRLSEHAPRAINAFVVYLSLPSLVLAAVTPIVAAGTIDRNLIAPIAMPWIAFAVTALIVMALGRARGWSRGTTGALVLVIGLGNTAFVGYPLIEWLCGKPAMPAAVLADQLGSFLVLSSGGVMTAAAFGGVRVTTQKLVLRMISFPPFLGLMASIAWGLSGTYRVGIATEVLDKFAATLVPVALFSVGASLSVNVERLRARAGIVSGALSAKLIVMPAFFVLFYGGALRLSGLAMRVAILQSAMAPMITSAILVAEFGLDEELAVLTLGIGIPVSLVTVTIWNALLLRWF